MSTTATQSTQTQELLEQLRFRPGIKKPEIYFKEIKKVLKKLGVKEPEIKKVLARLMARGRATLRLPHLVLKEVYVNKEALLKAVETFLKELPEEQRRELSWIYEKLAQLSTKFSSPEEFEQALRQMLSKLAQTKVIDVGTFISSLKTYLLEKMNMSEEQANRIIDEIVKNVFGGNVRWYVVESEEQYKQVLKKIEDILKKYNVPVYEVVTRYIPIVTKVKKVQVKKFLNELAQVFAQKTGISAEVWRTVLESAIPESERNKYLTVSEISELLNKYAKNVLSGEKNVEDIIQTFSQILKSSNLSISSREVEAFKELLKTIATASSISVAPENAYYLGVLLTNNTELGKQLRKAIEFCKTTEAKELLTKLLKSIFGNIVENVNVARRGGDLIFEIKLATGDVVSVYWPTFYILGDQVVGTIFERLTRKLGGKIRVNLGEPLVREMLARLTQRMMRNDAVWQTGLYRLMEVLGIAKKYRILSEYYLNNLGWAGAKVPKIKQLLREAVALRELREAILKLFESTKTAAVNFAPYVEEAYKVFEQKYKGTPYLVTEENITYKPTVEVKIPEFMKVFEQQLEAHRKDIAKIVTRLERYLHRFMKQIIKPRYQRVLVTYEIY